MALDWVGAVKWLGPQVAAFAKRLLADRDAAALQRGRDEHAVAAATEISRMILSGDTPANVNLQNLISEFEGLLARGARVPRDVSTMVQTLIGKARVAQYSEGRPDHQLGGSSHRRPSATGRMIAKKAAKAAPAKKAAKKAPAKKAAKRVTAKKPVKKAARW